jgi:hypothetical protein
VARKFESCGDQQRLHRRPSREPWQRLVRQSLRPELQREVG